MGFVGLLKANTVVGALRITLSYSSLAPTHAHLLKHYTKHILKLNTLKCAFCVLKS